MNERVLFLGGPWDGRSLPRHRLPALEPMQTALLRDDAAPGTGQVYRAEGGDLVFVETVQTVSYVGGPHDGLCVAADTVATPEGDNAVVPLAGTNPELYAWYNRRGATMVYTGTTPRHELEVVGG